MKILEAKRSFPALKKDSERDVRQLNIDMIIMERGRNPNDALDQILDSGRVATVTQQQIPLEWQTSEGQLEDVISREETSITNAGRFKFDQNLLSWLSNPLSKLGGGIATAREFHNANWNCNV